MDICRDIYNIIREHLADILSLRSTGTLKPDGSFVSKGDILCESLMFGYLKSTLENYIVISEESESDFSKMAEVDYVITIDPIDGTENFISGLKEWGIGISVYKKGKHYQSMLAMPELNICLCSGDKIEHTLNSRICGLSSYMTPEDFKSLQGNFEFRIMGCCMYNMYNVIKGNYSKFLHLKGCYSWDILPGLNLALENGLTPIVEGMPYNGEFLFPGTKYKFSIENK